MARWKEIVGRSFSVEEFDEYCHTLHWTAWRPKFIVLHNTDEPNLSQRPNGFTTEHMQNFVSYYRDKKGWSAGPHLFVDDKKIWVFCPLTTSGVHSPSWNIDGLGVEMLGNYNSDKFDVGRGLNVQKNTIAAIASLSAVLGLDPTLMKLHKEDKRTTHDDCPGKNVTKSEVIKKVQDLIQSRHIGEHLPIQG